MNGTLIHIFVQIYGVAIHILERLSESAPKNTLTNNKKV